MLVMATSHSTDSGETYEIRPYEYDDASDVVALYESIWGTNIDETWLHHRFVANPFVDHTTMLVADSGTGVVGVRPYVAYPVRANGDREIALLLNNLMVHPDHRRRGLFTRMTEQMVEDSSDDAAVTLNFANELSAPGYHKMGFDEIGTGLHKDVRLQRPRTFVEERIGGGAGHVAGMAADLGTMTYQLARRVTRSRSTADAERHRGIPADRLSGYETGTVDGIHTDRSSELYQWLAGDPRWRYWTYVADDEDRDGAAIIVKERVETDKGCWIADALPADGSATETLADLLDAVIRDFRDAPQLSVTGPVVYERLLPSALLRRHGFHSSTNPLLAAVTADPDTVFVNYFDDTAPTIGGLNVRDAENWTARIHSAA